MDIVNALTAFLAAHAYAATGLGMWIALATLANRTFWPKRSNMGRAEKYAHLALVDLPSLAAAPGYRTWLGRLGIPFFSISTPADPGTPPASSAPPASTKLNVLLPLALMAALSSACAGWPVFKNCLKDQEVHDGQALFAAVISLASAPTGYVATLLQLGAEVGPGAIDCVALALVADAKTNPKLAKLAATLQHLEEYLHARAARGATFDCKDPGVYVTVMIPPHDELAWFADGPQMLCVAHNRTARAVSGNLRCLGDEYTASLPVSLAPGEERAVGFCQVMNRDVHAEPCWIDQ